MGNTEKNKQTREDSIDPGKINSILASRLSQKINPQLKEAFIKHLIPLEELRNDPRDYRLANVLGRGTGKIHDIVDPSLNCYEDSWIATEFIIKDKKIFINGDINNIDKEQFPNLYDDIAAIFGEMFPYMNEIRDLSAFEKLNVIVKIQSYEIKEKEVYEGQFHQEGYKKEGIFMVGIYYFHISPKLQGGNLEVKYVKYKELDSDKIFHYVMDEKKLEVHENDIVIFLNRKCEHRITPLEVISAQKDEIYQRKILTFFISDPNKSNLPTTKNLTKLNKTVVDNEKEMIYGKRDEFRKKRLNSTGVDADYSENEHPYQIFKEISEKDFKKHKELLKGKNKKKEIDYVRGHCNLD